jgi:hypothetical protein
MIVLVPSLLEALGKDQFDLGVPIAVVAEFPDCCDKCQKFGLIVVLVRGGEKDSL